jgi:esterase/lipase
MSHFRLGVRQLLMSLETPVNLPFTRQLWTYDTAETLDKIKNPVLVVIGKKDIQTDWQADGKALENAAVNKTNIEFVYPENANHVLKHEETLRGQLTAQATLLYNAPNKEIDKRAADAIVNWLKKHA